MVTIDSSADPETNCFTALTHVHIVNWAYANADLNDDKGRRVLRKGATITIASPSEWDQGKTAAPSSDQEMTVGCIVAYVYAQGQMYQPGDLPEILGVTGSVDDNGNATFQTSKHAALDGIRVIGVTDLTTWHNFIGAAAVTAHLLKEHARITDQLHIKKAGAPGGGTPGDGNGLHI